MNEIVLSFFIVFGVLILVGYANMVKEYKESLWNGVKREARYFYAVTILASVVSGAYLLYYLTFERVENEELMYSGLFILLFFSTVWAFNPFFYKKTVLFMVSLGALLLSISIFTELAEHSSKNNYKLILAAFFSLILLFQTFVMDFLVWSGAFKDVLRLKF